MYRAKVNLPRVPHNTANDGKRTGTVPVQFNFPSDNVKEVGGWWYYLYIIVVTVLIHSKSIVVPERFLKSDIRNCFDCTTSTTKKPMLSHLITGFSQKASEIQKLR
jgi:hypothetical protein